MEQFAFIFNGMTAIGTFLTGIAAIIALPKVIRGVMFKNETLYGDEAKERFEYMMNTLTEDDPGYFSPIKYGGGKLNVPKFEMSNYLYDKKTMIPKRKGYRREARYYYEKDGVIMVEGWRLK